MEENAVCMKKQMMDTENKSVIPGSARLSRRGADTLLIRLAGSWKMGTSLPGAKDVLDRGGDISGIRRAVFDSSEIVSWDSSLATFLAAFFQ